MSRRSRAPARSCPSNFWSTAVSRRLHYLYALTIALGLTIIVAGCSGDMQGQSEQQEDGAGGQASSSGGVATGGSPSTGGGTAAGGATATAGATAGRARGNGGSTATTTGAAGQSASTASCPTYVDDFQPQVNGPVCSKCHQSGGRLADWGVYSQAKANCSTIGSRVASGAMPPPRSGYSLSAAQRALVASWVRLGCPQTTSELPSTCN
jgi:hypothetical protein